MPKQLKEVRCPECEKLLIKYIGGYASYEIKCERCRKFINIVSAGKTFIVIGFCAVCDFRIYTEDKLNDNTYKCSRCGNENIIEVDENSTLDNSETTTKLVQTEKGTRFRKIEQKNIDEEETFSFSKLQKWMKENRYDPENFR